MRARERVYACVGECVRACMRAWERGSVRARVHACVRRIRFVGVAQCACKGRNPLGSADFELAQPDEKPMILILTARERTQAELSCVRVPGGIRQHGWRCFH